MTLLQVILSQSPGDRALLWDPIPVVLPQIHLLLVCMIPLSLIILLTHGHLKLFFSVPYSAQGNPRRKMKGLSGLVHGGSLLFGHLLSPCR